MTKPSLRPLGRIVRLQIQLESLKVGEEPRRAYDPSPLQSVESLVLTPHGALLRLPDGSEQLDVHHSGHPRTRNRTGNDLSVGFTAHYTAMRACFGHPLPDGLAGENILVETGQPVALAQLERGLAIQTAAGLAWLRQAEPAPPCRPFSSFVAASETPAAIKAALQFLDNGMRGFYFLLDAPAEAVIALGDEVLPG